MATDSRPSVPCSLSGAPAAASAADSRADCDARVRAVDSSYRMSATDLDCVADLKSD